MMPEDEHRLACRHPDDRLTEALDNAGYNSVRRVARPDDLV